MDTMDDNDFEQPTSNEKPTRRKWASPITITAKIKDYKEFITDITQTLEHNQFTTRYNRKKKHQNLRPRHA